MNNNQKTHFHEHQIVSMLLPWYINKTLHNDENSFVETHLKSCLFCKIEVKNLQKLAVSINQEDSLAPVAHTSFLQLKKRIQKTKTPSLQTTGKFDMRFGYRQWLAKFNLKTLCTQHQGFVLATVLLFAVSFFTPDYLDTNPNLRNEFHTLSSTKHITTMPIENEIRVVFSSDITQPQITHILASVQGKIVAGPTPQGVFKVRAGKKNMSSKDLIKTISLLRKNIHVIFAEPSFAILSSKNQSPG